MRQLLLVRLAVLGRVGRNDERDNVLASLEAGAVLGRCSLGGERPDADAEAGSARRDVRLDDVGLVTRARS